MRHPNRSLHKLSLKSRNSIVIGSKQFLLKSVFSSKPLTPSSHRPQSDTCKLPFSAFPSKPTSRILPFCLVRIYGYSNVSEATEPRPVFLENLEERNDAQFGILKHKLEELGFEYKISKPGQFNHLLCPMAFDATRSSTGTIFERQHYERSNRVTTVTRTREISLEDLQLEPPGDEIIDYFASRMISNETLRRNAIIQKCYGDQIAIAFTYWRNGKLINCKYRDFNKRFWQEADTEKIFYGLDDIKEANEIIIVEGEMDKLAMEEAGFRNCVSVPNGAPSCISKKDLPPEERDTRYRYLWNCKDCIKKASRIILATDGDDPGQALAEELARRIGKERCCRVKWPMKNEVDNFKDANESEQWVFHGTD